VIIIHRVIAHACNMTIGHGKGMVLDSIYILNIKCVVQLWTFLFIYLLYYNILGLHFNVYFSQYNPGEMQQSMNCM